MPAPAPPRQSAAFQIADLRPSLGHQVLSGQLLTKFITVRSRGQAGTGKDENSLGHTRYRDACISWKKL